MRKRLSLSGVVCLALVIGLLVISCTSPAPAPSPTAPASSTAAPTTSAAPTSKAPATTTATATTTAPAAKAKYQLLVSCPAPPSIIYTVGVTQAQIVTKYSKVVNASGQGLPGGTPGHIERLRKGEAELGMISEPAVFQARQGTFDYKGKPLPDLVILNYFVPQPLHFVVRADSGITKMKDLDGKKFGPGFLELLRGVMTKQSLDVLGIKPQYVEGSYDDLVGMIQDNRIVGMNKGSAGGDAPDPMLISLQATTPMRLIGFSDEEKKLIQSKIPEYGWFNVPGSYFKQTGNFWTIGYSLGWGTRKSLISDEAAYDWVKTLNEHFDEMFKTFQSWTPFKMADLTIQTQQTVPAPFHAGAAKYFQELGYKIPPGAEPLK